MLLCEIPNPKHPARKTAGRQIPNKSQIPIINDQTSAAVPYCNLSDSIPSPRLRNLVSYCDESSSAGGLAELCVPRRPVGS